MFSYKFPAVRGVQAGREYYVSMVPLKVLPKLFITETESVSPEFRAQRRLNEQRIPEIRNYILNNRMDYVFSALSASLDGKYEFHPYEDDGDIGILEVNMDTTFLINDGQHRKAAIEEALKEDETLERETISVVFFEDKGLARSQQMFTDLNKHAVKTSNSISTLYDSRDELSIITKRIIENIPLFRLYTDKEKDNLGKYSSKLFTINNIKKANGRILKKSSISEQDADFILKYWTNLIENIVEWQEFLRKEISKIDLKQNYILCLNVTILAFGQLGAYFYENPQIEMKKTLNGLRKIDWSRSNLDNWEGRVLGDFGKVLSNETAVSLICNKIKQMIGIDLSPQEKIKEQKLTKK